MTPRLTFFSLAIITMAAYGILAVLGSRELAEVPLLVFLPLLLLVSIPVLVLAGLLPSLPRGSAPLWAIFGVGIAARLIFLGVDPFLSDDVYRYLWDGRVQQAGLSPYGVAPASPELDDEESGWPPSARVRDRVNHRDIPTIYPPLLELVFRGVAAVGGGLGTWRLLLLGCDLLLAWLLVGSLARNGSDPRLVVLYLWHPLPVVENIWSAHVEGIAVLLLLWLVVEVCRPRRTWAGVALGMGTAAKLLPVGFLPFVWRRLGWRPLAMAAGVGAVTVLPFWGTDVGRAVAGLTRYAETWYFNDVLFRLVGTVLDIDVQDRKLASTQIVRACLLGAFGLVCLGVAWRMRDPYRAGLWITGAFVLFTTTLHPWYALWILPFAIVRGSRGWLLLSVSVLAAYVVKSDQQYGAWNETWTTRALEFTPPLLLLLWDSTFRARWGNRPPEPPPPSPSGP